MEEAIRARVAKLKEKRTEFIAWAEKEVLAFDIRIDELQQLLTPQDKGESKNNVDVVK